MFRSCGGLHRPTLVPAIPDSPEIVSARPWMHLVGSTEQRRQGSWGLCEAWSRKKRDTGVEINEWVSGVCIRPGITRPSMVHDGLVWSFCKFALRNTVDNPPVTYLHTHSQFEDSCLWSASHATPRVLNCIAMPLREDPERFRKEQNIGYSNGYRETGMAVMERISGEKYQRLLPICALSWAQA